jgi:hypothetical protein
MVHDDDVTIWLNESLVARFQVYGKQIWRRVLVSTVSWCFNWTLFGTFVSLASRPWERRGPAVIFCSACCGILIRLLLELFPRTISITNQTLAIRDITWQSFRLQDIANARFTPINEKIVRMEFIAGRSSEYIVGIPAKIVGSVTERIHTGKIT